MKRDSEASRKNWDSGQEIIHEYLTGKREGTDMVKIAIAACGQHSRILASEANMETNRLVLSRLIYEDPAEREKYIRKSMPQMMIDEKKK